MDKKVILGVVALFFAAWFILLAAPDKSVETPDTLPWNISHPTPDSVKVFGIILGQTTLAEAERTFKEQSEISLFKPSDASMGVEAFIEEVNFNGLKAKMVLTLAVPPEKLQGMYERGLRMNSTPSGKRITLTADDLLIARNAPVASLTYLPTVRLEDMRVREKTSGVTHWLYPKHGLDIVLNGNEKPVLQYLSPKDFELLREPLLKNGEVLK
jgi:hypothetical protein